MKEKIGTLKVLKNAMKESDYSFDIYFRMAVIDEYLKNNEKIWELYNKMQYIRCIQHKRIPKYMMFHKNEFIELINNFMHHGYNPDFPIVINKNGLIIDGAHRMACALYFKSQHVYIEKTVKTINIIPAEYSKKWFKENELFECIKLGETQKEKIMKQI